MHALAGGSLLIALVGRGNGVRLPANLDWAASIDATGMPKPKRPSKRVQHVTLRPSLGPEVILEMVNYSRSSNV